MLNTHVEIMESIGRLGVALLLGCVIGFERQWHQKMAGLRTNALVALGSCGFVVCSAMVGTFAGGGFWAPSLVAAGFVVGTNLLLRPLIRLVNYRTVSSKDAETCYTVTLTCKSIEEAHLRSLLLHALSQGNLGLRRIDSADIPRTSEVTITAQVLAARRNDAALEQIVGLLSLEPHISAVTWEVSRLIPEA